MNKAIIERNEILKDFDLPWYTKDDLIDLLEKYPNLFDMPAEELKKLFSEIYFEAQYHSEKANRLENDADAIEKYYKAKYSEEHE